MWTNTKARVSSAPADLCQIGAFCFGYVELTLTGVCDLPFIKKTMTSSLLLALHATSDAAASVWIQSSWLDPNDMDRRGQTRQARFFLLFFTEDEPLGLPASAQSRQAPCSWAEAASLHYTNSLLHNQIPSVATSEPVFNICAFWS